MHAPTGSSKDWPLELALRFGPMSPSSSVNPDFHGAHRVYVKYCDGASFAGDAADLLPPTGDPAASPVALRFRGRRILAAAVKALQRPPFGLAAGGGVLLVGCSAGGLAVLLGADAVRQLLPPLRRFKALAGSGFFLDHASVHVPARIRAEDEAEPPPSFVYSSQMRSVLALQNLSATLSPACLAEHRGRAAGPARGRRAHVTGAGPISGDGLARDPGWAFVLAKHAIPFVEAPVFFTESTADAWQLG